MLSGAHNEQQEVTNYTTKIIENYDCNLLSIPIPLYIRLNYLLLCLEGALQLA